MHDQFTEIRDLFLAALERTGVDAQLQYAKEQCAEKPQIHAKLVDMLKAHHQTAGFLASGVDATHNMPASIEAAGTRFGPYKVRELLGEGGMGNVYVAEQEEPVRRKVALKIIKPGMDSRQVIARFEAERHVLALMDHPHIARVLDAGTTEAGRPYFVMELVRGVPITEFCDKRNLTTRDRLELFVKVCLAVQHAHQKGIIHRDIKPSNVLVTLHDDLAVPKVIDFGIAKATSQLPTEHSVYTGFSQMLGTPLYMSPEQAEMNALDIDTRSDVYSLGVLMYELITGITPFDGEMLKRVGFDEMRRLIREQDPPRPSERLSTLNAEARSTVSQRRGVDAGKLDRTLRGELDWIVMKALEKDRTRRYESASAFAADVQRYMNDEPVQACPPSAGYRLRKFARRNKTVLFAVLSVFIALCTGLAGTTLALFEAQHQRKLAETARNEESKQREQAQINELAARQAEEEASMVLDFFEEKVLASCRPHGQEGGLGKDVTVRQAIDAAEKQIAASFQSRPNVEASIRHAMGITYRHLGEPELGITQFKRVVDIRKVHKGPDHVATLNAVLGLAEALNQAGQQDQALAIFEEVLATQTRTLGQDHPDTLVSMNQVALSYQAAGKFDQALALLERILAIRTQTLGADHPKTLITLNNLGVLYSSMGKTARTLELHKGNVSIFETRLGPEHPDTLTALHNLAMAYDENGQIDLALPLYEKVLKLRKEKLGENHPLTLKTMNGLGAAYLSAENAEKAVPILEECLAAQKAKLGHDHPDTLRCVNNLAVGYNKVNRLDEALALLEQLVADHQAKHGVVHFETLTAMHNLANVYKDAGKIDEALPLAERVLEKLRETLGPDHPNTLSTVDLLADGYYQANRFDEALLLQEQNVAAYQAKFGANNPKTLIAMNHLARTYADVGKLDQAVSLAERVLEQRKENDGPNHPDTVESAAILGSVYLKAQQPGKALPLFHQFLDIQKALLGAESPELAGIQATVALELLAAGLATEAEPILRNCLAIRSQTLPDDWRTFSTRSMLGGSLLGQHKYADAEPLLLAGYEGMKHRETTIPPAGRLRLTEALERLVQLYDEWGKQDEAESWRNELATHLETRQKNEEPNKQP